MDEAAAESTDDEDVGSRYSLISTAKSSVNKWGISQILCIIYLTLTNSTSFGGFRCFTEGCSSSVQKKIIWSNRGIAHKRA